MADVPMPRASPMHPVPADGGTDPAIQLERLYAAHKEQQRRKVKTAVAIWFRRGSIAGAFLVGLVAAVRAEGNHAEHQQVETAAQRAITDEQHQRERDVDELKKLSAEHAEEHRKLDRRMERVDTKLELLLDAAHVPASKRPVEEDQP